MKRQRFATVFVIFFAVLCAAQEQQPAQSTQASIPTIKKETKLVLVDAVVTDKKGNYIRDLTVKDFRVWEDNKEQPIKTFSSETGSSGAAADQKRYLVLFFDESTISLADQARARDAAMKFLDSNSGADRYIAIVDFGGMLRLTQNFTTDSARLKRVVQNLKFSAVAPNADAGVPELGGPGLSLGIPQLQNANENFAARTLLLALRDLARGMASVPGRKSLILFSAGFPLNPADPNTPERESELTAAIDACNRSNVAVYPIDVHGLVTPVGDLREWQILPDSPAQLVTATFDPDDTSARLVNVQRGSSGTGHGSTGTGHGSTGTGTGTTNVGSTYASQQALSASTAPFNQARNILPPITGSNQQVLSALATGTGGFVIANSNDLLGGIQKIAQEQNQYYVLGYTPPSDEEGACHTLKVKVNRGDTVVRSRTGYCATRPADLLAGKPVEKQLEDAAKGSQAGNVAASMLAPYFYTSANTARVNLAIEIPANSIKFEKQNGKHHAEINVLGLAYTSSGTVAARFSDKVEFNFEDKKEAEEFAKKPYLYENQFEIGAGQYDLKVAFNSGAQSVGKLVMPLVIDGYDAKGFSMSGVALSKVVRPANQMGVGLDAELLENRTPLVTQGVEVFPAGSDHFKSSDPAVAYFEMYDPVLATATPPKIELQIVVIDRKTHEKKVNHDGAVPNVTPGNPVVALGIKLPVDKLPAGSYQLELRGTDSSGNVTPIRTTDFEVE
jgi:VWFA-related protein